jgi:hypothetical protein
MGNALRQLCNSIRIRSTCVSNCCSDGSSIDAIKKENEAPTHSHHHEIIITDKMVKIVCDDNQSEDPVDISSIGSTLSSEVSSSKNIS